VAKKASRDPIKEAAVLAAFIFLPPSKGQLGYRAADIVVLSPLSFRHIYGVSPHARPQWITKVTSTCKSLVKNGLLYSPGTVTRKTSDWKGNPVEYQSPVFQLTEAGYVHALSLVKVDTMPHTKNIVTHVKRAYRTDAGPKLKNMFEYFAFGKILKQETSGYFHEEEDW
jgi:hypothetical protein